MNAHAPLPLPLSDAELIGQVRQIAAFAESEIEAAYRFREGSAVRDWHLGRADQATVELLGLINGPQYRPVWDRLAVFTVDPTVPAFLRAVPIGGVAS